MQHESNQSLKFLYKKGETKIPKESSNQMLNKEKVILRTNSEAQKLSLNSSCEHSLNTRV